MIKVTRIDSLIVDIPPLFHAMIHRHRSAMHILLSHGANINVYMRPKGFGNAANEEEYYSRLPNSCPGGETPLSLSPHNAWGIDYTRELLQAGADPNFIFPDDDQPGDVVPVSEFKGSGLLQRICAPQFFDYAKLLVEAGADVNRQTALHGLSVLYWTILCHNMELLHLLLKYHVDVNLTTNPSRGSLSGLHAAVEVNEVKMARILIEHGASRVAKNARGETPLEMAHRKRLNEMVALLEEAP
jgi:ankyrin repeat protein